MIDEKFIRVSGEVLNERVSLDIRLTTEAPLTDVSDEMGQFLKDRKKSNFFR